MRVRYQKRSSQSSHLQHFQGKGLHVTHHHYGSGLGPTLGAYTLKRIVIPATRGAVRGAVIGALDHPSGKLSDKLKASPRGAAHGALEGVIRGKGMKKPNAKRPF